MNELIEISDRQTVSARTLYEKLGFDKSHWNRWSKQNIEENQFAIQGQDYEGFAIMANGNLTQDFQLSIDFAKRLCMMARTERGESIRNYFIEVERRLKEQIHPKSIEDLIIMQAQSVKELKAEVASQGEKLGTVERTLTVVKDTMVQSEDNWRDWVNEKLNLVARECGNQFFEIKHQSYKILEERASCDLEKRLRYYRERLRESGATRTKIKMANKLDIIEADPKLKEIYSAIVKELVIKYVA